MIADRRLYLTADKSEVVEENDSRAAWFLIGRNKWIPESMANLYGLTFDGEKVVLKSRKKAPENKMVAAPENKAVEAWTLKTAPDDYLKRYPDGPKAKLARQILANESESGGS